MRFVQEDGSIIEFEVEDAPTPQDMLKRRARKHAPRDSSSLLEREIWSARLAPSGPRLRIETLAHVHGKICALCRLQVDLELKSPHPAAPQADHIIPQSHGGSNAWGNLQLTHKTCNMTRSDLRLPEPDKLLYRDLFKEALDKHANASAHVPSAIGALRQELTLLARSEAMISRHPPIPPGTHWPLVEADNDRRAQLLAQLQEGCERLRIMQDQLFESRRVGRDEVDVPMIFDQS